MGVFAYVEGHIIIVDRVGDEPMIFGHFALSLLASEVAIGDTHQVGGHTNGDGHTVRLIG